MESHIFLTKRNHQLFQKPQQNIALTQQVKVYLLLLLEEGGREPLVGEPLVDDVRFVGERSLDDDGTRVGVDLPELALELRLERGGVPKRKKKT